LKNVPMRKCVGCGRSRPKSELVRIVSHEGGIELDPEAKSEGRGAYVCPGEECVREAEKNRGFQRSFKMKIDNETIERIVKEVSECL
jgi:predicted RNA-binding protein YlxR (DUF448 family)